MFIHIHNYFFKLENCLLTIVTDFIDACTGVLIENHCMHVDNFYVYLLATRCRQFFFAILCNGTCIVHTHATFRYILLYFI